VKPTFQFDRDRVPKTDCFFQTYAGRWHGWGEEPFRRRRNLGREYLIEAARERAKEMAVLGILLFAAAWPAILMVVEVARFYKSHHH
jgi:hypothetical protein